MGAYGDGVLAQAEADAALLFSLQQQVARIDDVYENLAVRGFSLGLGVVWFTVADEAEWCSTVC